MSKSSKLYTTICKYASAAFLLILLVLQFVPFWNVEELGKKFSISEYIWFGYKYPEIEDYIATAVGNTKYSINNSVVIPLIVLVACVVGIVYCLVSKKILFALFPIVAGLAGVVGYLISPELQIGSLWYVHVVVAAILLVIAALAIVFKVKEIKQEA